MRIQSKFLLLTLILTAGVITTGFVSQSLFRDSYRQKIVNEIRNSAYYVNRSLDEEMKAIERLTLRVCTDRTFQRIVAGYARLDSDIGRMKAEKALYDMLLPYAFEKNYVDTVHLLIGGRDTLVVGKEVAPMLPLEIAPLAAIARNAGGTNSLVALDPGQGRLASVRAMRQIEPLTFSILGVIVVDINMTYCVEQIMARAPSPARLRIQGPETVLYNNAYGPGARVEAVRRAAGGSLEEVTIDGERYSIVEYHNEERNWTYSLYVPSSDLQRQMHGILVGTVLASILLSCLFVVVISILLRQIIMPIASFTHAMQDFEARDFESLPEGMPARGSFEEMNVFIRVFTRMTERIRLLINDNYRKKIRLQEAEYRALQAQINPHFLYNTFDSINWLAEMKGEREISAMVVALSTLLRSSVADPRRLLTLEEELALLDQYVLIQKIRLQERFDYAVEIHSDVAGVRIPRLTLQPLVENSIAGCLEAMTDVCRVRVRGRVRGRAAVITVEDNGPGIPAAAREELTAAREPGEPSGHGMRNINERLKILFGDGYGLEIDDDRTAGARVNVVIPLSWRPTEADGKC